MHVIYNPFYINDLFIYFNQLRKEKVKFLCHLQSAEPYSMTHFMTH